MSRFDTVLTVARTEAKLFARSWIFRFLATATIIILSLVSWLVYILGYGDWILLSNPSGFPYFVFLVLTVFESLIVIFGSIESIHRDQNYNTIASLHVRNISNLGYVTGKVLGVLIPCLILNLFFLVVAIIAQLFFMQDASFAWQAFLVYPFVLNIPSLVFITGLSFLITGLARSKPFAMLVLVGYYTLPFFYRDGIIAGLIDVNAIRLPLLPSSIVGFTNLNNILSQRGMFLFFGIGFVLLSGLVFKRPPQSQMSRRLSMTIAIACIVMGMFAGTWYVTGFTHGISLREHIVALNKEYVKKPRARLIACDLDIVHNGSNIDVKAALTLKNTTDKPLNDVVLSLNPGFTVSTITDNGVKLDFIRDTQIIEITLTTTLEPDNETMLMVTYSGSVNNDACYPDIDPSERIQYNRVFTYVVDRHYGFITNDYVLLTPECQWYPSSGIPYGMVFPNAYERDFTAFTVDIETRNDLAAVAQGSIEQTGKGTYSIRPETPLPSLTLAVGNYEKKSVMVDSVEVAIYLIKGHDYFSENLPIGQEQVSTAIAQVRNSYELERGLNYPFNHFLIVETPAQFDAWERPWKTHIETIQPQIALVQEKGFYMRTLDNDALNTKHYEITGEYETKEQIITVIIQTVMRYTFMSDDRQRNVARDMRSRQSTLIDNTWLNSSGTYHIPGYTFSAQFCPFLVSFESNRYPIFNAIMEFYRKHGLNVDTPSDSRLEKPLLDEELICLALEQDSFAYYLEHGADFDTLNQLLMLKSSQLFGSIQAASGQTGFDTFLSEFIGSHEFGNITYQEFAASVNEHFGIDIDVIFENWYNRQGLPMFEMSEVTLTEIIDGEYTAYQTTLTVTNIESVPGTINITVNSSGNDSDSEYNTQYITIDSHQSKQIGVVTDTPPQNMTVNYLVAQNIPLLFTRNLGTPRENHNAEPFEGERIISYSPYTPEPGILVVDNLDSGFEIVSRPEYNNDQGYGSIWEMYSDVPGEFVPPLFRIPLKKWSNGVFNSSYGRKSTALFAKGGNGDGVVAWHSDIPESGRYDLEYYMLDTEAEGLNRYTPWGSNASLPFLADYNLTISHEGIDENIVFMPDEDDSGWQYVATFDLEPGQVDVQLSNKSDGMLIYADAIRWVKK